MAVKRYESLGFSPLTMSFSGLHTALQTGAVDGAAYQPPAQIPSFSNVTGAFVNTREDFEHGFWLVNKQWYESLPEEQREMIDRISNEVVQWSWKRAEEISNQWLDKIENSNVEIVTLDEDQRSTYKKLVVEAERDYLESLIGQEMFAQIRSYADEANSH